MRLGACVGVYVGLLFTLARPPSVCMPPVCKRVCEYICQQHKQSVSVSVVCYRPVLLW